MKVGKHAVKTMYYAEAQKSKVIDFMIRVPTRTQLPVPGKPRASGDDPRDADQILDRSE